jgi:uncharacterized Zn finger protein
MAQTPFDLDALRDHTGPRVFARGEAYAEAGHVDLVQVAEDEVVAHVSGTGTYVVHLTPSSGLGLCTCPAFEDFGTCKHVVATAVVHNGLNAVEVRAARSRLARLAEGLELEDHAALVARVLDLARRIPAVLADLEGAGARPERLQDPS